MWVRPVWVAQLQRLLEGNSTGVDGEEFIVFELACVCVCACYRISLGGTCDQSDIRGHRYRT